MLARLSGKCAAQPEASSQAMPVVVERYDEIWLPFRQ